MAGRINLIESVLTSISLYAMQTTILPATLCDELDRLTRRFLWGSTSENRRLHNVSWETIGRAKADRGLGFKPTRLMNQGFIIKLGFENVN